MKKRIWNNRGFTLMEMMIVIAVIAILAGTVGTAMAKLLPTYRFNSYILELKGAIENARFLAVRNDANVFINLEKSNGQFSVISNNTTIGVFPAPDNVDFIELFNGTDDVVISFNSRGFLSNSGNICLQSSSGTYKGVTVTLAGCATVIRSDDGTDWFKITPSTN